MNLITIGIKESCKETDIQWPWKEDNSKLPDNYQLAHGRLLSTVKRMDKELLKTYDQILQDQLKKGMLEKVDSKKCNSALVHYIPHDAVVEPNNTTKVRIV